MFLPLVAKEGKDAGSFARMRSALGLVHFFGIGRRRGAGISFVLFDGSFDFILDLQGFSWSTGLLSLLRLGKSRKSRAGGGGPNTQIILVCISCGIFAGYFSLQAKRVDLLYLSKCLL